MKVLIVFGTRPEAIKMAPLVLALADDPAFETRVCVTAQHREMLNQVLHLFTIVPDYDLDIMRPAQGLGEITHCILTGMQPVLDDLRPDVVLVHGDTTTSLAGGGESQIDWPPAPLAFRAHRQCPHQFAGGGAAGGAYRGDQQYGHRRAVLGAEPGNEQCRTARRLDKRYAFLDGVQKIILVTGHRRESFGDGFKRICAALARIALDHPDVQVVYPVHFNPNVSEPVNRMLSGTANIKLIDPKDYLPFVYLMNHAMIILTDSGGIQEESSPQGKPVLVMRDTTERPEAVAAGPVRLVGTDEQAIHQAVSQLLNDVQEYQRMCRAHNPYGDGYACERIITVLKKIADESMSFDIISVIGLECISLPTAAVLASRRKWVIGVDTNQHVVDTINRGAIHIIDPDLDLVVTDAVCQGLLRAGEPAAAGGRVPHRRTVPLQDDHEPDLSYVKAADTNIAYCPERVLHGKIMVELIKNDRVIGGMTPRCSARAPVDAFGIRLTYAAQPSPEGIA